ncbi:hypothetical protein OTU49_011848 [Cherax quadricarinatus]|uniref:Oplophorus-luciferin 2-monooxygenase non-catalytic subunit n=1 Tax=Cherax quadricarinatus TaxID=27406 RepID=A0AAW0W114_CHEQU
MVLKAVVSVVVLVGVVVIPAFTSSNSGDLTRPQPREWPCPIETDFYPCVCTNNENYELSIDCSAVETDQDLSDAFYYAEFPFSHFKEFKIEHDPNDPKMTLTTLDPYTFRTLTFERITISGTKIEIIQDEDFSNSHDTLTYLNLASNKITYFPFDSIQGYTNLQTLSLDDNQIEVWPNFESDSLEYLSFSGNEGITLTDFTNTPNLREIYMARNKHDTLPYQLFWNLFNLTVVDLQRNEMTFVDEYYIASQSNALTTINLDHNKISVIRHDAFHGHVCSHTEEIGVWS